LEPHGNAVDRVLAVGHNGHVSMSGRDVEAA
jgi:hypothetical protein